MSSEEIYKVSEQRSRNMSAIKSKNTKPEIKVRKVLHSMGYRFRLHRKDLPGSPDIVLPKYKTVIFVHGCFWHRHENCKYATTPKTRKEFWEKRASLGLVLSQPFQEFLEFENELQGPTFTQRSTNAFQSRNLALSFSYRFGKLDFNNQRNRPGRSRINNNDTKGGQSNSEFN